MPALAMQRSTWRHTSASISINDHLKCLLEIERQVEVPEGFKIRNASSEPGLQFCRMCGKGKLPDLYRVLMVGKREIKCNGERPTCLQCTRIGKECSGYRNQLDLMFCDQSSDVRSKFSEELWSSPSSEIGKSGAIQACPSVMKTLEVGIEDHARGFFFNNYVLEDGYALSSYDYLPELYSQESGPLHPAILAVGMAELAIAISSPCTLISARRQYTLAPSLTCPMRSLQGLRGWNFGLHSITGSLRGNHSWSIESEPSLTETLRI
ncbi:hypothetical protein BDZ45DRAFT_689868 [Acephala macrosclerotiorum]|nr:hypothetical protein BDZ45DRAFT_689868 [Acephala macrosclerotiorum]